MVYELPNVEAFEDREYKMLPLPTQTKRPILEGHPIDIRYIYIYIDASAHG